MNSVRTFVAVLLAEDLVKRIAEAQAGLANLAPDVKWVAPGSFHVTLKFLGNVREDALAGVYEAVAEAVRGAEPFDLAVSGLGAFPNPKKARVVWVAITEGREQLVALAAAVDARLARLGFAKEEKPFKGHITIGRVKSERALGGLAEGIEKTDASDLGTQRVESVAVMQSELLREGPIYSPLSVTPLS